MPPVISGVAGALSHGEQVTITGSGFGTRQDHGGAEPFLCKAWRNFIGESTLTIDATIGGWTNSMVAENIGNFSILSDTRYIGGKSARKAYADPDYVGSEFGNFTVPAQSPEPDDFYFACYFRFPDPCQSGKIFRHGNSPNFWFSGHAITADPNRLQMLGNSESCGGCSPAPATKFASDTISPAYTGDIWNFIEILARKTPNELAVWLDGKLAFRFKPISDGTETHQEQWLNSSFNGHATVLNSLDDVNRGFATVGYHEASDMYLDYTPARVFVSELSTYSAGTPASPGTRHHREIQIPLTWADGEIQVELNQGSFGTLAGTYLYVVDSSGVVSDGFLLEAAESQLAPARFGLTLTKRR